MIKEYIKEDVILSKNQKIGILANIITVSGLVGWLYEFIFYYLNSGMKQFYMRGSNFLPWINIYAYGAILILVLTYKRRKNPFLVFLISLISTGILEYFSGYILYEKLGFTRCWSYNEEIWNFGNINGFVCLRSVVFFGISGLFLMYILLPLLIKIAKNMNEKKFLIMSLTICSIFVLDEIYNFIICRLLSLPRASTIYKSLGLKYIYFKK